MEYKIWNKQETLITPKMEVLTPQQVFEKYPAAQIEGIQFIIANQPINMAVFMEFEATKQHYTQLGVDFSNCETDQDVLNAITAFEETPQEEVISAEERIAAALEFQAAMSIPMFEEEV